MKERLQRLIISTWNTATRKAKRTWRTVIDFLDLTVRFTLATFFLSAWSLRLTTTSAADMGVLLGLIALAFLVVSFVMAFNDLMDWE